MPHRCKKCGRAFRKFDALIQHEKAVHEDRPKTRASEIRRFRRLEEEMRSPPALAYTRQAAVARSLIGSPAGLLPLGGIVDLTTLAAMITVVENGLPAVRPVEINELEPPTIEGEKS